VLCAPTGPGARTRVVKVPRVGSSAMAIDDSPVKLTYEDYVHFPEDGRRHELIEGDHHVTPAPNIRRDVPRSWRTLHDELRAGGRRTTSAQRGEVLRTPSIASKSSSKLQIAPPVWSRATAACSASRAMSPGT